MRLLTYADLHASPPLDWLVDGVLPVGALAMVYGPSGSGKTFCMLDMAHSVSTGERWLGRETRQGPGLYVVAEGRGGFPQRAVAWCAAKRRNEPGPMRYLDEPVRFHDDAHVAELVDSLAAVKHAPALMIVDTFAAVAAGGDENSAADAALIIGGIKAVQRETGCAAVIVHHTGWDKTRERGSSSIRASMDVVVAVTSLGGGNVQVKVDKMRDGATPPPIICRLRASRVSCRSSWRPSARQPRPSCVPCSRRCKRTALSPMQSGKTAQA
jgi:RecA-family ATPase